MLGQRLLHESQHRSEKLTACALLRRIDMHIATSDSRLRLAELTSALGAGILGVGIGALAASFLRGFGIPILIVGIVLHAWGMTDKHRLEAGTARPAWSTALYWICWVVLAGLAVVLVVRALT